MTSFFLSIPIFNDEILFLSTSNPITLYFSAIAIANDTPYGLAAFLQTGDKERAERVACKLRAGAVHINGAGIEYGTPFGGYKQSGNGREGGMMGLEDYLETKTLHGLG